MVVRCAQVSSELKYEGGEAAEKKELAELRKYDMMNSNRKLVLKGKDYEQAYTYSYR